MVWSNQQTVVIVNVQMDLFKDLPVEKVVLKSQSHKNLMVVTIPTENVMDVEQDIDQNLLMIQKKDVLQILPKLLYHVMQVLLI